VFEAIKRKFGASVSFLSAHTMRAEVYCWAIDHNIISNFLGHFQSATKIPKHF